MKRLDDVKFDKRVVKKYIDKGALDSKEYDEYLKSLPDDAKNAEAVKVFEEENLLTFSSVEGTK